MISRCHRNRSHSKFSVGAGVSNNDKNGKLLLFITTPRWMKFVFEFSGGKIEMTRPRKRLVFVKGAKNYSLELLFALLNL